MGLTIRGIKTGLKIICTYRALHRNVRYLALKFCRMPDFIDEEGKEKAFTFFMNPWIDTSRKYDIDKFDNFLFSLAKAGHMFPNIMLHADYMGSYTKRGKINLYDRELKSGSLPGLKKELELLLNDKLFTDDKYKEAIEFIKVFYNIVCEELKIKDGYITFS